MQVVSLDHIVLTVRDVEETCRFYRRVLGMEPRQDRPGKWSLHFGANKISLQDAAASPEIARDTVPGSGNFCLLTETPVEGIVRHLHEHGVTIATGPAERVGATGPIMSVYFRDPDGNLVEVSSRL
jgi:catechol 2,3-dioxygenase-like lactoylglutathione lyase family enzyme